MKKTYKTPVLTVCRGEACEMIALSFDGKDVEWKDDVIFETKEAAHQDGAWDEIW